ncbi:DUF262 domain-containing protein [Trichococcus pasteurii]|uniref:GmrSD restriction endonucleases N-terminal domain-containing protein n=1 Tax=Trichococcus pasteurii TaxID=43064 RepID=A0A1W1IFR8_9LACT|nr:DUF262 domain-containing protein [Trichococcus pasteurii]SFE59196.1 hypothetical protein SAMN04488086_10668 [Trichococcus pasteurii]SLM51852.1 Hypothetical protein TPAS_1532 [Trichococcus pasteurii]SSB92733.1 Hypothetical protein TPAS_1532 [Trichococcus pasteurii]
MAEAKPDNIKYVNLLSDIDSGRVKIPQFQREYVWSKEDAAKLIDSVLRGYPIGTFILWKTRDTLRSVRDIGGLKLKDAPEGDSVYYVLDGQQRITSLYAGIKGVVVKRENFKNKKVNIIEDFSRIYIDLTAEENDEQIVVTDVENLNETQYISLKELLDMDLLKIVTKYNDNEIINQIGLYRTKIQNYQFSIVELTDAPIEVATEVFTRLNTGGKTLTVFEIMSAKMYNEKLGFDLAEKHDAFLEELETKRFGAISNTVMLQLISLILNKDCIKKSILSTNRTEFIAIWDKAVDATRDAIDYFRTFYRIPVSGLLPYDSLLVPFAYFFCFNNSKKPDDFQRKWLQDYFWRCCLTSRFSSGVESKMAQDIKKIESILSKEEPEQLGGIDVSLSALEQNGKFTVGRAYIKALICILSYHDPKSFDDGSKVILDNDYLKMSTSKNYHHFFPRAYLSKKKIDEDKINHIANITLVDDFLNKQKIRDKAPSVYMKDYVAGNENIVKTMKSHLINDLDTWGIWTDEYDIFFNKRLAAIQKELKERLIINQYDRVE